MNQIGNVYIITNVVSDESRKKMSESHKRSHIPDVCNGKRSSCFGYKWKWKNNE